MTLEGTNTWILGVADQPRVVIDPGPPDDDHLRDVAMAGEVGLIVLTHGHLDHSAGAARLHALTGAPVAAYDEVWLRRTQALQDGEEIRAGGLVIEVLHTPGHSRDSLSFFVRHGAEAVVVTGDTILGRGTTLIDHPEGRLADYFASLERLGGLGEALVLPGHGPVSETALERASAIVKHRRERLAQVRLAWAGGAVTVREVVDAVYGQLDADLLPAAERNVAAQIEYLRTAQPGSS